MAALELIESEGHDGFSMRKLAASLGCEAMSIYHYFPSKAHLRDALLDRCLAATEMPPRELPWLERLRRVAYAYREAALRNPRFFVAIALHRMNTAAGLRFLEGVLDHFPRRRLRSGDRGAPLPGLRLLHQRSVARRGGRLCQGTLGGEPGARRRRRARLSAHHRRQPLFQAAASPGDLRAGHRDPARRNRRARTQEGGASGRRDWHGPRREKTAGQKHKLVIPAKAGTQ